MKSGKRWIQWVKHYLFRTTKDWDREQHKNFQQFNKRRNKPSFKNVIHLLKVWYNYCSRRQHRYNILPFSKVYEVSDSITVSRMASAAWSCPTTTHQAFLIFFSFLLKAQKQKGSPSHHILTPGSTLCGQPDQSWPGYYSHIFAIIFKSQDTSENKDGKVCSFPLWATDMQCSCNLPSFSGLFQAIFAFVYRTWLNAFYLMLY